MDVYLSKLLYLIRWHRDVLCSGVQDLNLRFICRQIKIPHICWVCQTIQSMYVENENCKVKWLSAVRTTLQSCVCELKFLCSWNLQTSKIFWHFSGSFFTFSNQLEWYITKLTKFYWICIVSYWHISISTKNIGQEQSVYCLSYSGPKIIEWNIQIRLQVSVLIYAPTM